MRERLQVGSNILSPIYLRMRNDFAKKIWLSRSYEGSLAPMTKDAEMVSLVRYDITVPVCS